MSIEDKINIGQLKENVTEIIQESLSDVVDGAEDDMKEFGRVISEDIINISQLDPDQREDALSEVIAQAKGIGEVNRIRAINEGWEMTNKVLRVVGKSVIAALTSLLMIMIIFTAGCKGASKGYIHVNSIQPLFIKILDRHDKYINSDTKLNKLTKSRYLRSSAISRKVLNEAERKN